MPSFSTPPTLSSVNTKEGVLERNPLSELIPPFFNLNEVLKKKLFLDIRRSAFDLLARREYCFQELQEKLFIKFNQNNPGISMEELESLVLCILRTLQQEGLQSDIRYVEMLIRGRMNQGYGLLRIQQELRQKKVSSADIDRVLVELKPDWYLLASKARKKKFGESQPVEKKEVARQIRFLQYRGFNGDEIQRALGKEWD